MLKDKTTGVKIKQVVQDKDERLALSPTDKTKSNIRKSLKTRAMLARENLKRYRDLRFRKNEEKIFKFYYESDRHDSVETFSRKSGMSKSAFYRHHRKIYEIQADYEDYTLHKFSLFLKDFENYPLKGSYRRLLCFMATEKRFFKLLPDRGGDRVLRAMVYKLKPKILNRVRLKEIAFATYTGEIIALLRIWALDGCNEGKIEDTLNNIMFLTDTAHNRLNGLQE